MNAQSGKKINAAALDRLCPTDPWRDLKRRPDKPSLHPAFMDVFTASFSDGAALIRPTG